MRSFIPWSAFQSWRLRLIVLLLTYFVNHSVVSAQVVIGPEAQVSLPSSANFRIFIGNAPDSNVVQTLNPPIFKWIYYESPWNAGYPDYQLRTFRFQLTTNQNGSFANPYFDVTTSNNFFNCLPPITNPDGSTFTGTNYWQIIYMQPDASTVISTSAVQTFTMSSDATVWDRSRYANTSYLLSLGAQHPHMFFFQTNLAAMTAFLHTNSAMGFSWQGITQAIAYPTITNSWWNKDSFSNQVPGAWAQQIADVCLAYAIDSNATLKAANPGQMVSRLASSMIKNNYDQTDQNAISESGKMLALAYDWAYNDMTAAQASNVLWTLERFALFYVDSDWWYTGTPAPANRDYSKIFSSLQCQYSSGAKASSDHPQVDSGDGMYMTLAGLGESAILRDCFSYFINYNMAQLESFNGDQGRGYTEQSFRTYHMFGATLLLSCLDQTMTNIPWISTYPTMLCYLEPLWYSELQDQEGDFAMENHGMTSGCQIYNYKYYDVAVMLQNGYILQQQQKNYAIRSGSPDFYPEYGEAFLPYYFPYVPAPSDFPSNYYFSSKDGWCMSYEYPPNNWNCFTNGVGFVFSARPEGSNAGHDEWHDGDIDMFAYGAHISFGGIGQYDKHAWFLNGLFVDGIGNCTPNGQNPTAGWYSRMIGFTNSTAANNDYTYVGAELGQSFNNYDTNGYGGGGLGNMERFYGYSTNARPYITSVQRHILFPHHRYLVLYDQFETTKNAQFMWKWNVLETKHLVATPNAFSFQYTSTNFYNGSNVTVYVQHVANTNQLTLMNLVGTNYVMTNPFTGENLGAAPYYAPIGPLQNATEVAFNNTLTTNWHFLSVIFPVQWNDPNGAPRITRITDNTVEVQQGAFDDVISFNETNASPASTMIVSLPTVTDSYNGPGTGGGGPGGGGPGGGGGPTGGASGPFVLIAHTNAVASGNNTATTQPINTTSANLIVINASFVSGTPVVSDSSGNSYTPLSAYGYAGGYYSNELFYVINPNTGPNQTFSLSLAGGSGNPALEVQAFSLTNGASPVLDINWGTGSTGNHTSPVQATARIVTTGTNELVVAGGLFFISGATVTVTNVTDTSGDIFMITDQNSITSAESSGMAYFQQGLPAAIDPIWDFTENVNVYGFNVAAFGWTGDGVRPHQPPAPASDLRTP